MLPVPQTPESGENEPFRVAGIAARNIAEQAAEPMPVGGNQVVRGLDQRAQQWQPTDQGQRAEGRNKTGDPQHRLAPRHPAALGVDHVHGGEQLFLARRSRQT
jgi:hypothetical protein